MGQVILLLISFEELIHMIEGMVEVVFNLDLEPVPRGVFGGSSFENTSY